MTTVVTISSSTQCSSPEPRSKVLTPALVFKPTYSNKRSQIPRLKKRCHKSKSPYSLSIDSGKCGNSISTFGSSSRSGSSNSNNNYSISTKDDSSYNHNLADPTPFTHLSDSSPCSPTSTTTHYLATPEWASSDQSCRSYLTLLTSSIKRSNECDSDSDSNSHSSSSSSSSFSKSEKLWTKRSLTNPSSASYSFSFGCLSSPFNGKRQKKAKTHNHNQDLVSGSNGENSNNMPYNSYCSVCTEYRNFYQKSCDLTNNYMECEKCHSATRRRCSSPSSLLNTNYVSFPSIDESLSSSSNIEINPATATSSTLTTAIYLPLADNEESLMFSSTAPSFDSISTAEQLQKLKKPLFSSFSLPLSSA